MENYICNNMEVDVKYTVWGRYTFDNSIEDEVLERIKKGEHPDDVKEDYATNLWRYEDLLDTSEPLTVEDNQGFSTIEIGKGDDWIYTNGKS